jgi:hypothetical protein
MKRLLFSLSSLGLVSLLIMGASVSNASAENKKSPLRGAWSFSQFVPATTLLGTPTPIPVAAAGTLLIGDDNSFTGHAVFNTPAPPLAPPLGPVIELDFNCSCTFRQGEVTSGMDCTLNFPDFGLLDVGRFCVVMAGKGGCFEEFRCVNTNEPGTVLFAEFKRQQVGTCK